MPGAPSSFLFLLAMASNLMAMASICANLAALRVHCCLPIGPIGSCIVPTLFLVTSGLRASTLLLQATTEQI